MTGLWRLPALQLVHLFGWIRLETPADVAAGIAAAFGHDGSVLIDPIVRESTDEIIDLANTR